ncbi:MAG: folate-binding protein [Opitutus sp.]
MNERRGFLRWNPAAWLRISGDDAFAFLQGQFTNDLRGMVAGQAVYGLWLNHKGKVLADSFVLKGAAAEFWVGSYFSPAATIKDRLEAFIIADDVIVEDVTAQWSGVTVFEPNNMTQRQLPSAVEFALAGRRIADPHREWIFPAKAWSHVQTALMDLPELSAGYVERWRIEDAIPAVPADLGPGELPNEGGLEVAAISYTKGCYLGQEVMARLKAMGQVRRQLMRLGGSGPIPVLPAPLFQGDRRIGELRTASGQGNSFLGLALLSRLHLDENKGLSFSPGGDLVLTVIAA